jgi:hypothetical protein
MKELYAYVLSNHVMYVGRCLDSFRKCINQGYGKIYPKSCYIDGQATNCHLNSLITANKENVSFYVYEISDGKNIMNIERKIIQTYQPAWNIALLIK